VVPTDKGLADRCFAAARELYAEVGTYCVNTKRVARFSRDEMDAAMAEAPTESVWGEDDDAFTLRHRGVEGNAPVFVYGGLQTLLYTDEETMLRVYRACCRCRAVAGIWGGIVTATAGGGEIRGGSPQELLAYLQSVRLLRRAAKEAGRPGMCVRTGAPSSAILAATYAGKDGLRPSDGISTSGLPELKVSFDDLERVAFAMAIGSRFTGAAGAVIGGFSGSVEGAAIVAVAGAYQARLVNRGEVVGIPVTPIQVQSRATRRMIWVSALALQAASQNTGAILVAPIGDHPAAGPGTAQYFYETAAAVIPGVVSGAHPVGGTRKFSIGRTLDYGTPLESEFQARVSEAAVGMDLQHARRVSVELLGRYEKSLKDAPRGATLRELYDLDANEPLPAYRKVCDQVVRELQDLGVPVQEQGWYGD
jgi:methylamine--corrinoid protein Co-methyltransferase